MGDSPALRPERKTAAVTHGEIGAPNSDGEATAVQHIGSFNPGPPDTDQPAHRSAPASTVTNSEVAGEHIAQHAEQTNKSRPKDGLSCPRCQSTNTKFCYYNNYNTSQPRYICKKCQRYWTAGGQLRDVPEGAGRRRKSKLLAAETSQALSSGISLSTGTFSLVDPFAVRTVPVVPAVFTPSMPPPLGFPAVNPLGVPGLPVSVGDSLTKVTANALMPDPATVYPESRSLCPNGDCGAASASSDGAVNGSRKRARMAIDTCGTKKATPSGHTASAIPAQFHNPAAYAPMGMVPPFLMPSPGSWPAVPQPSWGYPYPVPYPYPTPNASGDYFGCSQHLQWLNGFAASTVSPMLYPQGGMVPPMMPWLGSMPGWPSLAPMPAQMPPTFQQSESVAAAQPSVVCNSARTCTVDEGLENTKKT